MYLDTKRIEITLASNGWVVEWDDPEIKRKNELSQPSGIPVMKLEESSGTMIFISKQVLLDWIKGFV